MPNAFAYIAIATWPVVAFCLFRATSRPVALISTIVAGYLLLPTGVGFDLPMVPTIDKSMVMAVSAAIFCFVMGRPEQSSMAADRPGRTANYGGRTKRDSVASSSAPSDRSGPIGWLEWLLLAAVVLGPFATALQNSDPAIIGARWIQGLTLYDGLSTSAGALIIVLPYLLARRFLAGEVRQVKLLTGLGVAALVYTLPTLFEIRMSPQLSRWVYGFLLQSFGQAVRGDGFRPVVFLQHGLWLALFLAMGLLATASLWRGLPKRPAAWLAASAWILITLSLSRSLGALVIAFTLLPVVFLPTRHQIAVACSIALIALAYPTLRGSGLIPVTEIANTVEDSVSADRAQSFTFRLENEDKLLARANERPLTGWGGWGRSRIYDPNNGNDTSTTDGTWIILIGVYGWLGYVGQFGLLALPLLTLVLRGRDRQTSFATAGLSLVLAANLIDLIPNATLTPVTWLVTGALMGGASARTPKPQPDARSQELATKPSQAAAAPRTPRTSVALRTR